MSVIKENLFHLTVCLAVIAAGLCAFLGSSLTAYAAEETMYTFTMISGDDKYDIAVKSSSSVVAVSRYSMKNNKGFGYGIVGSTPVQICTLDGNNAAKVIDPRNMYLLKRYTYENNVWTVKESFEYGETNIWSRNLHNLLYLDKAAFDFRGSNIKLLYYTQDDIVYDEETDTYRSATVGDGNVQSYLLTGRLKEVPEGTDVYALTSSFTVPMLKYGYTSSSGYRFTTYTSDLALSDVSIDENGVISWTAPLVPSGCIASGVCLYLNLGNTSYQMYYKTFPLDHSLKLNLNGLMDDLIGVYLYPYYITSDGRYMGASTVSYVSVDASADYSTNEGSLFEMYNKNKTSIGIEPGDDSSYYGDSDLEESKLNVVGSDIPAKLDDHVSTYGTYDSSIPKPNLVFTGNGYKFNISNAESDYYIEVQGRWYTVDDVEIYRSGAMWKYKYSTICQNGLTTWVKYEDLQSALGTHDLSVYGKSSFADLLRLYPIDSRNYYGSTNAVEDYLFGYNDALEMLTDVLLPGCTSIYNGCEVYIRFCRADVDNNILAYGKWTHWYDALAKESGSSGSTWDDKENMYTEYQSEKGLTDEEKDALENTGSSKSDKDSTASYNEGSGSSDFSYSGQLTDNVGQGLSLIDSMSAALGSFPSWISHIFSFLPAWSLAVVGLIIVICVILRIVGR